MATVTEDLDLPDGTPPTSPVVVITLVGDGGNPVVGYVDGVTVVGKVRPTIDADGSYTVTLPANGDIIPAGTRWKRKLSGVGIPHRDVDYWNIEEDGSYDAPDVLAEIPGEVESAALSVHKANTTDAHGIDTIDARIDALEAAPGGVTEVNGQTGAVTLDAADVGAATADDITTAVADAIDALVAGAPGALDTLNELAEAVGDDADFAGTVTAALAAKTNTADLGTAAFLDVPASGDAAAGEVVKGDDSRLSGTSGLPTVGTSVSPETDANAARPDGETVYWKMANGVTPANAQAGDLIWNANV